MEYEIICDTGADISIYQATDFELMSDGYALYDESTGAVIVAEDVIGLTIIPSYNQG
jgi:hypothetical protein